MIKKLLPVIIFIVLSVSAVSQSPSEIYVQQYKDLAIREMKRMGVPAAITLAQGLLETESGNSELLKKSNNHFGIKCKSTWSGNSVSHDDDASGECFRTYKNAEESYRDHSNFLRGSERYSFLFNLNPADYKAWAYGLKRAGYATNPRYPEILIKHIEDYNLQQYSLAAIKDVPAFNKSQFQDDKEEPFIYNEDSASDKNVPVKASYNNSYPGSETASDRISFINSIKAVWAPKGTSLLAIATRNDIQLAKLLEYNDMITDGILQKDQFIFLQKKSAMGAEDFYITQKNETLHDVAQQKGIQLEYLAEYNHLTKGTVIEDGTKLYLQPAQSIAANDRVKEKTSAAAARKTHLVQEKEGLYSISKKYGVTIQQLKEWNNLTSDNINIGQELIVEK